MRRKSLPGGSTAASLPQPATASARFAGSAGVYHIEVGYFDESDGRSSLAFLLNGELLDQWIADEDPACRDCASPNERTLRTRVVARGIPLSLGDELALQGTGDYYEYARFDNIAVSPAGLNTLEAEDMTLDDGFVVEANAAASGGQIIRVMALRTPHQGRQALRSRAARVCTI